MKRETFTFKGTPEQFGEFASKFFKEKFSEDGVVVVPIRQPNGDFYFKIFEVDPSKKSYDDWVKELSIKYN